MALMMCSFALNAVAAPQLHPLFQDHAVLQRDKPMEVWGTATAGEQLAVAFAGVTARTQADRSGQWSATLPAMPAGGPYELKVSAGTAAVTIADVMVGDVWLCSGQSNMVLQVHRALNSRAEIQNSADDSIRLMNISLAGNVTPQSVFADPVQWQQAAPDTVRDFSAACWYFGRELKKHIKVPLGLIASAWGGSKIETWMSNAALQASGRYGQELEALALSAGDWPAAYAKWGAIWESWWRGQTGNNSQVPPWSKQRVGDWRTAPRTLGFWEDWGVPELEDYTGMLWYRTTVMLSPRQAAQPATLSLGEVDEIDQTWINGRPAGANPEKAIASSAGAASRVATAIRSGQHREYPLPRGTLQAGENSIVVNVLNTYGSGGLHGPMEARHLQLADGTFIPLDGQWLYRMPAVKQQFPPRPPWDAVAGLGIIYNAMIAPLTRFSLRGVAWYQGESNTGEAGEYQALLTDFMSDWRAQFGAELPFLIVQLANYGMPPTAPVESGWAQLREAQRLAVAQDANAGLAVAIDIGDRYDIHPANKQEVGRRLARAARHVAYGEAIVPSGPVPLSARREGSQVIVSFGGVARNLVSYSATGPIGFELCGTAPGSCRYVDARMEQNRVLLDADGPPAAKVRYCWADSPVCTLYDEARLPAGPFAIEVQ